ncbi:Rod shape-determining protein MreD [hydrothermal vent metagenome]|uniref:Rod shape-determining protein MreD n=1 Tax=hydrothermal vent metagenome TaxID=652676 RepID=A0A3B0R7X9_9ZZZZ
MADRASSHLWLMRFIWLGLCLLLIFLHLLPLDTTPRGWAAPQLIIALTFAWVLRRPEYVPPLLIALVFLLADLLQQRPPGLWAALVLIGSEALRVRATRLRDMAFAVEWIHVAVTLVIMTLSYRLVLSLLLIDQASLGLSLTQMLMTLISYPLIVIISQTIFRVRKLAPGNIDAIRPHL